MILAAILSMTLGVQSEPGVFRRGDWQGTCFRQGYLGGMDHELCLAQIFIEAGAQLERSAEGLSVHPLVGQCRAAVRPGHLSSAALYGRDRAKAVTRFIRSQIAVAVKLCQVKPTIPPIRESDIAAFLRASDGLKAGTFVQLDPAVRAPAAKQCGKQLEEGWRAGLKSYSVPVGGRVSMMMYTFSKPGPERADKRFAKLPAMMESFVALRMGPGGAMISAEKSADAWRDPPSEWFVTMCDIGIEAWSGFVELSLEPQLQGMPPIFVVRAPTGVAASDGFVITRKPFVPQPQLPATPK